MTYLMTSQLIFVEHLLCIKHGITLGPMTNRKSIKYAPAPQGKIVSLAGGEISI